MGEGIAVNESATLLSRSSHRCSPQEQRTKNLLYSPLNDTNNAAQDAKENRSNNIALLCLC